MAADVGGWPACGCGVVLNRGVPSVNSVYRYLKVFLVTLVDLKNSCSDFLMRSSI